MARAELAESWVTAAAPGKVLETIERLFAAHKVGVIEAGGGRIRGKQGSQFLTRLLGGWFVSPAVFPKLFSIRYEQCEPGSRVDVRIEEAMGFGVLDSHFKSRYEGYFAEFMAAVKRELPPLASSDDDVVTAETVDPPAP
jgi:hypothetical protein